MTVNCPSHSPAPTRLDVTGEPRPILATCPCCGWKVIVERDTPDGQTCWACYRGERWKDRVTEAGPDARAAAKDLIRHEVEHGLSEAYIRGTHAGMHSPARYSARIMPPGKILVNAVHGRECHTTFSLHEVYEQIRRESTTGEQLGLWGNHAEEPAAS